MDTARKKPDKYKKPMGAYIPPAKRVKSEKFELGTEDHQRLAWEENKRKLTGLVNRASANNITTIVKELFNCNLVRYKGLFATALIKAQESSPMLSDVYAALLAVINSRIRTIGILVINRLILQYRVAFVSDNKPKCLATVKFLAHLTNQEVVHEVLPFQIIDHLIHKPTADSIELVIAFVKECGAKLEQLNPIYLSEVFKTLREIKSENILDTRTDELIDFAHQVRRNRFADNPPIKKKLDILDEDEKETHKIELSEPKKDDFHMELNYFKLDQNWVENEKKYDTLRTNILNDEDSSEASSYEISDNSEDEQEQSKLTPVDQKPKVKLENDNEVKHSNEIIDETKKDVTAFRRNVYLTIRSSIRYEEIVHKLMKSNIGPEWYEELCQMILDCCGQERTYEAVYGLVASRLCELRRREFAPIFEDLFGQFYEAVVKFENNKIRNVAKFYAHLLSTETIDWNCLSCIKLREDATSSAGRCFVKFLFQELASILSVKTLIKYTKEPEKVDAFKDIFPRDPEQDTRFSINFFTFSGLGELTVELRQELISKQSLISQ